MTGTQTTFLPAVTLTELDDGSYRAEVDWFASINSAFDAEGNEIDVTSEAATSAAHALDRWIENNPEAKRFTVERVG